MWFCRCKQSKNSDSQAICPECGRLQPQTDGKTFDVNNSGPVSNEILPLWYFSIFCSLLIEIDKHIQSFEEFVQKIEIDALTNSDSRRHYTINSTSAQKSCSNADKLVNAIKQLNSDSLYKDNVGAIYTVTEMASATVFRMGRLLFFERDASEAYKKFLESFRLDPNQESLMFATLALRQVPIPAGRVFKGNAAEVEQRKTEEKDLLKKLIQLTPMSSLAIRAARMLMEEYDEELPSW
jgi:hypothetical protein